MIFGFVILTAQNYLVKNALSRAELLKGFNIKNFEISMCPFVQQLVAAIKNRAQKRPVLHMRLLT